MARWLLKTEPSDYGFHDLEQVAKDMWDGVKNAAAQKTLRAMQPGDAALIYHTGGERAVVGVAKVVSGPYPDPTQDGKLVAVDVQAQRRLSRPVTLAEIKQRPEFAEWELVRQPRLSVMPVSAEHWRLVEEMSKK